MNISRIFIGRPIMTGLIMASIFMFGILGYRNLPVSDLPNIDFPTIQVTANLPGANPDTMAAAVATPLEKKFSTIAGLDSMSSASGQGETRITLQFKLNRNIDAAAQDVQSAIAGALSKLPPDMPNPPTFRKVNPADQPILFLVLSSPTLSLSAVDEYAENYIAQRISTIDGVAQVQVRGAQKYAVRIQLDPETIAARGIGIDEIANAISNGNVNTPTGTLQGPNQAFALQVRGQLLHSEDYKPLIVAYRNGSPVRLQDISNVIDSVEEDKSAAWHNTDRAIILTIQRQPGTNTVQVTNAIKKLLPSLKTEIPESVKMDILYDRSVSILASANDVKYTLLFTIILVIFVIFLFLRNLSATVIPSLALPISIVGTFAAMHALGFSLDNLSLMALTLSVGFVVDDAIVMLENIFRHIEKGEKILDAALSGAQEVGFTIISMTLSLVAVFIPVLFMSGILGRLLHEFAVTIGVAILVSCVVSLSLTPMLCSRYLRSTAGRRHNRLYDVSERYFLKMFHAYEKSLGWVLKHRVSTIIFSGIILCTTVVLFIRIPKGFLPGEDTGQIYASTEAAQGISFDSMVWHQQAVADILRRDPNIDTFMSAVDSGGANANAGNFTIRLKPRRQRKLSADQIITELRPKLSAVPGIKVYLQNPPPIRIGGMFTKSQYQFTLQNPDTTELYKDAALFQTKMNDLPGLQDVNSDLQIGNPQINIDIDRDRASAVGITVGQIERTFDTAYGSRQISTIMTPNNDYSVIMEFQPQARMDPSTLSMLYIQSNTGALIPLYSVAKLSSSVGPLSVNHIGQLPSVTLSFNLKPGTALGDAISSIKKLARENLPATVTTSFQGSAQAFQSSLSGLIVLLFMAIFVIYIVLGILYESLIHPLTILSALPFAGFGALVTLMAFHMELNIYGFVGIIMLMGLVKKNGIMMVDFALETERREKKEPEEAIYQACLVRFRPIMMTTMSALMGTLIIAIGLGAGGESRRPLGLAVVGGLFFSQFLTLYVTPVIYVYMDRFQKRFLKTRSATSV